MFDFFESAISYVLGGMSGVAVGYIVLSFDLPLLGRSYGEADIFFLIIAMLTGMLIAAGLQQYRKIKIIKHNTDLKDEIVALITHEMRTGLTSTRWVINFILEKYKDALSEEDKKNLSAVARSTEVSIMHSVNFLDVSLLDIEKLSISLKWMPLSAVETMIREILEKYAFGAERKGIKLESSIDLQGPKQVEVDVMRLRIVIENLLENAIQYMRENPKVISVKIHNDDTTLYIVVKDTGIGIPKEEQGKIFSEFYRASNARKKLSSGSGIGLYISNKYIKAHKGTIRFESEEHKGTTFFITLPLKTREDINEFLTKV